MDASLGLGLFPQTLLCGGRWWARNGFEKFWDGVMQKQRGEVLSSVHYCDGLQILILRGSGLQIQTNVKVQYINGVDCKSLYSMGLDCKSRPTSKFSTLMWRITNPYTQWVWIANPDQLIANPDPRRVLMH